MSASLWPFILARGILAFWQKHGKRKADDIAVRGRQPAACRGIALIRHMKSSINRADALPVIGQKVSFGRLLRQRLLWRWALVLGAAFVVLAGVFVFAYLRNAERFWRWEGVASSASLALWVGLLPPIVYAYVFAHEFGHLLPFLPRAAWNRLRRAPDAHPRPSFLLIGRDDRYPNYAHLFSILGTEVRLGVGLMGWADEPDMRAESEFFVRFMAGMGHFFPCAVAGVLFVGTHGWAQSTGWVDLFVRWGVLLFPFLVLLLDLLLSWGERRTDFRIVVFGKREMYPEG
ncbi:MAG: hypothetical protein HZA32_10460 [Opitutae bacterium]|nr:hypothetical protein [Opitutae bacterium]